MSTRKKVFLGLSILIAVLLIAGAIMIRPMLPIVTGYAAKNLCSCHFVAQRDVESIEESDLDFSLMTYTKSKINEEMKVVTSSIFGLANSTAYYIEGVGCSLDGNQIGSAIDQGKPASNSNNVRSVFERDSTFEILTQGVDFDRLNQEISASFDTEDADPVKGTRGVVVLYNGQLVGEAYADGFDETTPQLGWSMSKSITCALLGILVDEFDIDINLPTGILEWQNDNRKNITLNDLLQMSSGLEWNEFYGSKSDVTSMLYMNEDVYEYGINKSLEFEPGTYWEYSSGSSNILSGLMRRWLKDNNRYWAFPKRALFDPLGMSSAVMELDASGNFVGSSYTFATPRDWAKFGQLFLDNGKWNGQQIVPEKWVEYVQKPAPVSKGLYGGHFWLNASGDLPDVPRDMYAAHGFQGQRVFIIPSRKCVIVRMGLTERGAFDFNAFVESIIECLPKS